MWQRAMLFISKESVRWIAEITDKSEKEEGKRVDCELVISDNDCKVAKLVSDKNLRHKLKRCGQRHELRAQLASANDVDDVAIANATLVSGP